MGTQLDRLSANRWMELVEAIHTLSHVVFEDNKEVGWWDESTRFTTVGSGGVEDKYLVPTKLALIHSEISEALEGFRKNLMDDHLPRRPSIEVELADTVIRILDLAGYLDLDLGGAIMDKLVVNGERPDHKREARNAPGGKAV